MNNTTVENKKKIIACRGDAYTPARFWEWAICTEEEFSSDLNKQGWVKSSCANYLNTKQLSLLIDNQ